MATQVSGAVGPQTSASGSTPPFRQTNDGSQAVQDSHGRYQEAVVRGNVYRLSANGVVPTAYVGATGGTPLLSVYNPVGSGKNLVILAVGIGTRVLGSGVLQTSFALWGGVSVANTGTLSTPVNAYTMQTGGSVASGSSNTATTSTTAINANGPVLPIASHFWGTSVGSGLFPSLFDVGGLVICAPGNLVALGATVVVTSATYDVSMFWEEVPILA